ncbi:MAG: Bax inhibitor-1 family protein [Clostridia bacterium]|nr:Bax inhibitor-1 family protein [Clostridia bacterium]
MICPNCNSKIDNRNTTCPLCGAELSGAVRGGASGGGTRNFAAQTAGNTGLLFGAAARAARINTPVSEDEQISVRAYNGVLLGVLLWGLLVNVVLCSTVHGLYNHINPIVFAIGYAVCALAGIFISRRSSNPWISFLGYNLIVVPFGLMLSTVIEAYGGISQSYVADAFLYTLLIAVGISGAAILFPALFEKLGGMLMGVLIGLIVCEAVLLILGRDQSITDWIAAGVFSIYIGYDVHRSQQFPKTLDNAVDSALDIYLDVANLFIRILSLLARSRRRD